MIRGVFVFYVCTAISLIAQSSLAFEVSEIKRSAPESKERSESMNPAGLFRVRNTTVEELLPFAFHSRLDSFVGVPAWCKTEHFDIVAKTDSNFTEASLGKMLQALLVSNFQLKFHEEQRPRNVFALVVASGGLKLRPAAGDGPAQCERGQATAHCKNVTMADFVDRLPFRAPDYLDRPLLNFTETPGKFDVTVDWVSRQTADTTGGLTLFAALKQQAGLELQQRKLPTTIIVIDRAENLPHNQ